MEDRKNNCGLLLLLTFVLGFILGLFIAPDNTKNSFKIKNRMDNLLGGFKSSMNKFLKYLQNLNLDSELDKEGEKIIKETIDKADQIMNEI